ncbi:hypothetical protein ACFW08_20135 [Streptomyces sp. NPDC058960]|uniref:hypothetical protein n=1 Tax=Streptomyces sp. NPDC058960 TaxID=3346679 RepID=UPI0036CDE140
MNHTTRALCALYVAAASLLLVAAATAATRDQDAWAAAFGTTAVLLAAAFATQMHLAEQLRNTRIDLEHATRPPGPSAAAIADEITLAWHALGQACCLRQWETSGREHDPDHCTRKDQTT